jgi:hypothetical protein
VTGVAVKDRGVTVSDLPRMVHDDNLGGEVGRLFFLKLLDYVLVLSVT